MQKFVPPGKYMIRYGCVSSMQSDEFEAALIEKEVFDLIISDNNMGNPLFVSIIRPLSALSVFYCGAWHISGRIKDFSEICHRLFFEIDFTVSHAL